MLTENQRDILALAMMLDAFSVENVTDRYEKLRKAIEEYDIKRYQVEGEKDGNQERK